MKVEIFFESFICIKVELEKAAIFCFQKVENKVGWVGVIASTQEHISHIKILTKSLREKLISYT